MSKQYPNLAGTYRAPRTRLLVSLQALGEHLGKTITINSGRRTLKEQASLYANRASNPYPVAAPSVNSPHIEGVSADAEIDGRPIQEVVPAATLKEFGLEPLAGDAIHVQIAGTVGKSATQIQAMAREGAFGLKGISEIPRFAGDVKDALKFKFPGQQQAEDVVHGAEDLPGKVLEGIVGDVAKSAESLMLNIGLIGGGAFLVYYGAALMLGVKPIKKGVV
jgi:hypothetical protein